MSVHVRKNLIELTEDDFASRFPLLRNHLNANASFSLDGSGGCLFETFGCELEFVRNQPERFVWTLIDADGELLLISGFRVVDRVGYVVSTVQCQDGFAAQVRIL